eukprot:NODE_4524_length_1154_cov_319.962173_g4006_i0.p1 GENE.NODE_4524_length_1154_cov_319.962173_g4006_i0~~NODE_4524_length_1154_cov_319.962173_g4006_i0.p1  ORF type:complete len:336 (-),score=108.82 NODE_4524_length_1154_cov_319.962173_g4006_i0:73-1080(-)
MKINIASPIHGTQKVFDIEDEKRIQRLYEKRVAQEFEGEILGDQFKGYTFKITGGQDKEGFAMKQGVLTSSRVRLLLSPGEIGFQSWRAKSGERRRRSVRGCILGPDLSVLNVIVTKEGEEKLEGLTDRTVPRRLGPKRADKIRKLFNLTKEDDVRKYVLKRTIQREGKKPRTKSPKIQRLITPITLERKRRKRALIAKRRAKSQEEREKYQQLIARRRSLVVQKKRAKRLLLLRNLRLKELGAIKAEEAKKKAAPPAKKVAKPAKGPAKGPAKAPAKESPKPKAKAAKEEKPVKEEKAKETKPAKTEAAPKKDKPAKEKAAAPKKEAKPKKGAQ